MVDQVQGGHEHQRARGYVLTLSTPFVRSLGQEQLRSYVDALVDVFTSTRGEGQEHIAEVLGRRLDEIGIARPDGDDDQTAEQFASAGDLSIVTDNGEVLYGKDPRTRSADVVSSEDPESGDRPLYS